MNTNRYTDIAAQLIAKYEGIFGPLYEAPLSKYLSEAEEILSAFCACRPEITCNSEKVLFSAGHAMMETLLNLTMRTFLDKLFHVREQLSGDTPEARYRDFVEHHLLPYRQDVFSPETALGHLVAQRVDYSLTAFREFFERLDNDSSALTSSLNLEIRSIEDIHMGSGDTHNSGKSVFILTVDGGEKLVYKPHSTANDDIVAALFAWLNESGRLRLPLRHIRTLSRPGYGWQEFIKHEACQNQTQAENYMYRIGALLFFTYLIHCNDLHLENLLAAGEYPFLVDTETICANHDALGGVAWANASDWDITLAHSVFSSLLLPTDYLSDKPLDNANINGILGGMAADTEQKSSAFRIVNHGTDQIGYAVEMISHASKDAQNIPVLDGQQLHAGDYIEFVSEGFLDAYQSLLSRREEYLALMDSGLFDTGVFRQLQRNTELYFKYLLASYHPAYIQDRPAVFARIKGTKGFVSPAHEKLVNMEIRQLLNDDIPYFYTTFHSRDLLAPDGDCCVDYFGKSVRQQLRETVERLNEVDLYRQLYFIRTSIASPRYDRQRNTAYTLPGELFAEPDAAAQREALLTWIVDFREKYHRIPFHHEEVPSYYCLLPDLQRNQLKPEPGELYHGIGSFLFYLYHRVHVAGISPAEALRQMEQEHRVPSLPTDIAYPPALFEGLGSHLYLNLHLYRISGQAQYLTALRGLCEKITAQLQEGAESPTDVISGCAGLIIFALKAWAQDHSLTMLYELALLCGEILHTNWQNKKLPVQTGFAHGYAGYSTALLMLGSLAGREDYYQAGMELIRLENSYYEEPNGWKAFGDHREGMNAWCYGAPGILAARESARPYVKEADLPLIQDDIARALALTKREVLTGSPVAILCHGLPGNLSVLRWYARHSGDDTVLDTVVKGDQRLLDVLRQTGIIYEFPAKVLNISFMAGLTGLGYYLLDTTGVEFPSVLALEA